MQGTPHVHHLTEDPQRGYRCLYRKVILLWKVQFWEPQNHNYVLQIFPVDKYSMLNCTIYCSTHACMHDQCSIIVLWAQCMQHNNGPIIIMKP